VLRKAQVKAGETVALIKLEDELQGDVLTEEKIVGISGNVILTLKTQYKKTPIQKTDNIKLITLEFVQKTQTLELKDLISLKPIKSIPLTNDYGRNCRFFNLASSNKESLKSSSFVTFACEIRQFSAVFLIWV
jgi:hypothetical protein